jgi:glycine cleavage system H protein
MTDQTSLQYTAEHEWVLVEGDTATVFVELPKAGSVVSGGTVVGEIESTKSVGELFAPVDGTIVEANAAVDADPSLVNSDPFGEGWLIKVNYTALPTLLSFDEYSALIAE